MMTHEIAKLLSALAQALRNLPNQTLDELASGKARRPDVDPSNIPMALSTLVALSDFDKSQWQSLIKECNFSIEVRPRDASRGKLLRYLETNTEAWKQLTSTAQKNRSQTSPELMRALEFLLKT
jgi:hypothetical protein